MINPLKTFVFLIPSGLTIKTFWISSPAKFPSTTARTFIGKLPILVAFTGQATIYTQLLRIGIKIYTLPRSASSLGILTCLELLFDPARNSNISLSAKLTVTVTSASK